MRNILLWTIGSIGAIEGLNYLPTPELINEIFKWLIQIIIAIVSLIQIFKQKKEK